MYYGCDSSLIRSEEPVTGEVNGLHLGPTLPIVSMPLVLQLFVAPRSRISSITSSVYFRAREWRYSHNHYYDRKKSVLRFKRTSKLELVAKVCNHPLFSPEKDHPYILDHLHWLHYWRRSPDFDGRWSVARYRAPWPTVRYSLSDTYSQEKKCTHTYTRRTGRFLCLKPFLLHKNRSATTIYWRKRR